MPKSCTTSLLLLLLFATAAYPQDPFERIQFASIGQELPKRGIRTITQDKDGFIWLGSDGAGLFRFDGSSYTQFLHNHQDSSSIRGNNVYSTLIDDQDRMWVGTNHGLNEFKGEMGNFRQVHSVNRISPNGVLKIKCIFQLNREQLLLGTIHFGVVVYNAKTEKVSQLPVKGFAKEGIDVMRMIRFNQHLYALSSKGLLVYDPLDHTFDIAAFPTKAGVQTVTFPMQSMETDADNNLWLGTQEDGMVKITATKELFQIDQYPFTDKRIMAILVTKESQLFCSTENDGLILIKKDQEQPNEFSFRKFEEDVINSNSIWSLFQDSQRRIWAGTFNKGVFTYDGLCEKFEKVGNLSHPSLQARAVSTLVEDHLGNIWVGIDGGGINIYNPQSKQTKAINTVTQSGYKGLTSNCIVSLYPDKQGNIWVGTWGGGIFFLPKNTKRFVNYNRENTNGQLTTNRIQCFSEDSKGRIWIGTFDGGLQYFDPKKNAFVNCRSPELLKHEIPYNPIRAVKVDHLDNVWVGSPYGLYKIKMEEQESGEPTLTISCLSKAILEVSQGDLDAVHISTIHLTKDNQILIGTEGAGLLIISPEGEVSRYTNDNYQERVVSSILDGSDNTFWISGADGIANIKLDSDEVVTFNKNDGFDINYFYTNAMCSSTNGTIYYGNDTELNYFKPDAITFNEEPPKLHLANFKIFNKEVTPFQKDSPLSKDISKTKKITLDYGQRVFSIGYVGVNFTHPERNQYAYQLEGVDPNWRYVGNKKSATYTNLEAGNYTFRVKATNNDNVWTPEPLTLELEILPPWWDSKPAYLVYLLSLCLLIYAINRFYRLRLKAKHIIQIERQKRLQEEQLSQQKLEFFTNISHEFRTPLTLIINPLEDIIHNQYAELPTAVKHKVYIAHKNSSRLNRLINQLMDFRKIQSNKMMLQAEKVEVVSQVKEILDYFSEDAMARNISLNFVPDNQTIIAWLDVNMLEKIIFNLLSNAFKVTPNNGSITVSITERRTHFPNTPFKEPKEGFEISVRDTGGGLTKNEISQIFQRFSQVNRTKNTHYGGTGIGLEIVKAMVLLHGGHIDVSSKVGKGSDFKVSFLLGKEHFKQEEILHPKYHLQNSRNVLHPPGIQLSSLDIAPQSIQVQESSSKENTILIVEDNLDLADYLKMQLEEDYHIIMAENGKVAFEIAAQTTPNVILTDIMMPVMDGFDLCKKIRGDAKTSHIPLIMLTAKSMSKDKLRGINSGADAYITKPIQMALLQSTIKQLLTSRRIWMGKFSTTDDKSAQDEGAVKQITSLDNVFIKNLLEYIHQHLDDSDLTVESIASHFFLSRSQLYRKTKALTGITVNELIRKTRLEKAREMIKIGDGSIGEIAFKVGFTSPSYFAKCFKNEFGKLPTEIN
ncbi:MAG: two-component regulator propeller domain-containing protein [Bacteroidota bacterium]